MTKIRNGKVFFHAALPIHLMQNESIWFFKQSVTTLPSFTNYVSSFCKDFQKLAITAQNCDEFVKNWQKLAKIGNILSRIDKNWQQIEQNWKKLAKYDEY